MRRANRKIKLRKSTRYFYIILATALLVVSLVGFMQTLLKENIYNRKHEIYSYENRFSYDYNVNLTENEYIDAKVLEMGKVYVTDLIEAINLNLNYTYAGSSASDIEYKYRVSGKLQAAYTKDSEEQRVWEKDYVLVEEASGRDTSEKIRIEQPINLDLREQNDLVKKFEQKLNMSVDAKYTVIFEVETFTKVEGVPVKNKYISTVVIDLAEKTTKVTGENGKQEKDYVTKEVTEKGETNIYVVVLYVVLLLLSIRIYFYVFGKTATKNIIKNVYRKEINRVLQMCQDKIVQVDSQVARGIDRENIIDVKDLDEIIKISEELFKPILYLAKDADESWFLVMSNQITYRFIYRN